MGTWDCLGRFYREGMWKGFHYYWHVKQQGICLQDAESLCYKWGTTSNGKGLQEQSGSEDTCQSGAAASGSAARAMFITKETCHQSHTADAINAMLNEKYVPHVRYTLQFQESFGCWNNFIVQIPVSLQVALLGMYGAEDWKNKLKRSEQSQQGLCIIDKGERQVIVLGNYMEELQEEMKFDGVSFRAQTKSSLPYYVSYQQKPDSAARKVQKNLGSSNRPFSSYKQSLKMPESPNQTMEFLCRSWSPSASDFLDLFPSSNFLLPESVKDETEEREEEGVGEKLKEEYEKERTEETLKNTAQRNRIIARKGKNYRMDLNHMMEWLKGKSLTSLLRSHREKKKEEMRFQTAKLHAALSLTRLAAAIAGFSTNVSIDIQDTNHFDCGGTGDWNQDKGVVVASAAALMTTVCAEAAESLGAQRSQVACAVNSGLAIQTPTDMITVTATAATCLRGAAALKSRALADSYSPRSQDILKVGAQICIIMPSGQKEYKLVNIYLKYDQLTLSFRKKYLGGALTTSKQYKVINITEEPKAGQGSFLLSLKTDKGIIRLLFEDEKQSTIWKTTISNLLKICNPR
ncbi:unnamed protein product [Ilex paraguariensis]|uniref:Uncharacterized protein n=1 Tax=Ilex paraguariensis TaxID=185542 RepID=A0ABC8V4C7_9AQUA